MYECTAGCDVLRALYSELAAMLDARIVAVNMYQRNALTLKELQSIQSLRDRPVEAAETLLNIIVEQPDAVYLCFLDVLKRTEQQHIYQRLVEDGYKGKLQWCIAIRYFKCDNGRKIRLPWLQSCWHCFRDFPTETTHTLIKLKFGKKEDQFSFDRCKNVTLLPWTVK